MFGETFEPSQARRIIDVKIEIKNWELRLGGDSTFEARCVLGNDVAVNLLSDFYVRLFVSKIPLKISTRKFS